ATINAIKSAVRRAMSSAKSREIPLEETIRKVLQSELKLIFPAHFFQDSAGGTSSSLIAFKQIVAPMESKMVSQNNIPSASKDSSLDESMGLPNSSIRPFLPPALSKSGISERLIYEISFLILPRAWTSYPGGGLIILRISIMRSIGRISSTHGMETICGISKNMHKKLILHGVSEVLRVSGVSVLYALWDPAIL
ncbi:3211_t:CDS:2, partial [Funneliformis geosporum]